MKIRYEFVNGEVAIVEVNDEVGRYILDSRRKESSSNRYHRRWCRSLDAVTDKSEWKSDLRCDPCHMIAQSLEEEWKNANDHKRTVAFAKLSQKQKDLLEALCIDKLTEEAYAKKIGVTQSAIAHQLATIRKKLKKLL